ncbi:MAG: response regulator [Planctomycetota bacterium]
MPKQPDADPTPSSIRMATDRLDALLDKLDADSAGSSPRRGHARLPFRTRGIEMEVMQPSGGSVTIHVACRNLSRGGMSVLHSAYMHLGTTCKVRLRPLKGAEDVWLSASVVQCRHVSGRVHEVGLRFAGEVDVQDFVAVDRLNEEYSLENVDPAELRGRVLLITGYDLDRKLVEVYLSETNIRLVTAKDYEEAEPLLSEPFDVVLCDFDLDANEARDMVRQLRSQGRVMPLIALSSDSSNRGRAAVRQSEATGFLSKPLQRGNLLRALGEFMVLHATAVDEVEATAEGQNPELDGLAEMFAEDLQNFAGELEKCQEENDAQKVRYICARIRGTGPLLGHGMAAAAADRVLAMLAETGEVSFAVSEIHALIDQCNRAKAG